jgi:acyl dehydratase
MRMEKYYKSKSWEEVEEGELLPEINMFISYRKVIQNVVATRDFFPGHHNPEYARAQGVENIYLQTHFFLGIVDRLVTDAFGPTVLIKRRRVQMLAPIPAGSKITVFGRVSRKYVENGEKLVDVDVSIVRRDKFYEACKAIVTALFSK